MMSSKTYLNAYLHAKMIFNKIKEKYHDNELSSRDKESFIV